MSTGPRPGTAIKQGREKDGLDKAQLFYMLQTSPRTQERNFLIDVTFYKRTWLLQNPLDGSITGQAGCQAHVKGPLINSFRLIWLSEHGLSSLTLGSATATSIPSR